MDEVNSGCGQGWMGGVLGGGGGYMDDGGGGVDG